MRKCNTTDRPLLIASAFTKNANGNERQNTSYCPGIVMNSYSKLLVLFAHIIDFSVFSIAYHMCL